MAKKRATPKRRAKKKPSRKSDPVLQLAKILGALSILLLLVVSAGLLMREFQRRPATNTPPVAHMPVPPAEKTAAWQIPGK